MSSVRSILKDIAATDHWLRGPLFANSKVYGQTILAAFFVNLLGLISSFFIMTVYDRVIPNNAIESLVALTVGVLFAHLFDFILKSLRGYFIDVAGQRLIFVFVGAIALIGGPIAIVPLVGVLGALAVALITQPLILRNTKEAMKEGHAKHSVLIETLAGLETVKSVAAGDLMRKRWKDGVLKHARISTVGRFINQLAVNFSAFAQQGAQVGVVVAGVMMVGAQSLSMGGLIACVILTGRAMAPLAQVAGLLGRVAGALSSYKSLDELMSARSEVDPGRDYLKRASLSGRIEFRDVGFQFFLQLKMRIGEGGNENELRCKRNTDDGCHLLTKAESAWVEAHAGL